MPSYRALFIYLFVCLCLYRRGLTLSPMLQCSGTISAPCILHFLGSSDSPASASWVAGTAGIHHYTPLIFVFLQTWGLTMLPRLVSSNPGLKQSCLGLPKCWDYRSTLFYLFIFYFCDEVSLSKWATVPGSFSISFSHCAVICVISSALSSLLFFHPFFLWTAFSFQLRLICC